MFSFTFLLGLVALFSPSIGKPVDLESLQTLSVRQNNISKALDWDPSQTPFPPAHRDNTSFTYTSASNGQVVITDPYNWLENVDGEKSQIEDFQKSQVSFTKQYLDKVTEHDQILNFFNKANNYTTFSLPYPSQADHYLYSVSESTSNYDVWYLANQNELDEGVASNFTQYPGTKILDESLLGVNRTIDGVKVSPDGGKVMYTVYDNEADGKSLTYFRDTAEGVANHYSESIPYTYQTRWRADSESIFYVEMESNASTSIFSIRYHKLGTDVKDDKILLPPPADLSRFYSIEISDDSKYFLVSYAKVVDDDITVRWYATLLDQPIEEFSSWKWIPITVDDSSNDSYLTNVGEDFYWINCSNETASRISKIHLDFSQAKQASNLIEDFTENIFSVQEVVPWNNESMFWSWSTFDTNKVALNYLYDGESEVLIYDLVTGKELQNITFDGKSIIEDMSSLPNGKELYLSGSWMSTPVQLFKADWNSETNQASQYQQFYETSLDYFKPEDFIVEKRSVPSTDGVEVPIWLLYHKDNKFDGSTPAYVELYGAFGINDVPGFDQFGFSFVHDFNGIYVIAQIRGGGEFHGEYWHDAGKLENKHHSFEDLIATANYLVEQKLTSPGKIVLYSESSGAITEASIINQAPEGLFGAVIAYRAIFDVLVVSNSTEGDQHRIEEFGNPNDTKAFDWLYAYSPLQNINKIKAYPIIVVLPRTDDESVQPWQSYKYIATLQYLLPSNPNPFLLTESKESGDDAKTEGLEIVLHALGLTKSNANSK